MELTILESVLIAALVAGLFALALVCKRVASWSRGLAVVAILSSALYGSMPYILLKGGVIIGTPVLRFIAGAFFIAFTLIGTFVLNFGVERQNLRGRGHIDP